MKLVQKFLMILLVIQISYAQEKIIPDFKLESINGDRINFYDLLKTGPVYINFWALWCVPCRAELKALQSLYDTYKNKGFNIIAVNIDSPRSSSKVKSFISSQKYSFPVFLDQNQEIFQKLNGRSLPYSLLIDADGKIVKVRNSYLPGDEKEISKDIESVISRK